MVRRTYRWVSGFPEPFNPPPLPLILLERMALKNPDRNPKDKLTAKAPPVETHSCILEGRLKVTLTSLTGLLVRSFGPVSEKELLDYLRVWNETRCQPPLREDEVRAIAHSVMSYGGRSVDPMRWLEVVETKSTAPAEFRTARAYAEIAAKCGRSEITPAALYVCTGWRLRRTSYFRARTSMQRKGCIRVTSRGRKAPRIELASEIVNDAQ